MKTKCILFAASAALMVACNKRMESPINDVDQNFIMMAAYGNNNEVDAGVLDTTKATDLMVKDFGRTMITDHLNAQDELKRIAKSKGLSMPAGSDDKHKTLKQQLMSMSGWMFDSAYIHNQVMDHQTVIDLFTGEINNGKDEGVKSFAAKYLPTIKMHFNMADSISRRF